MFEHFTLYQSDVSFCCAIKCFLLFLKVFPVVPNLPSRGKHLCTNCHFNLPISPNKIVLRLTIQFKLQNPRFIFAFKPQKMYFCRYPDKIPIAQKPSQDKPQQILTQLKREMIERIKHILLFAEDAADEQEAIDGIAQSVDFRGVSSRAWITPRLPKESGATIT